MYTPASVFCSGVERFAAPTDTLELAGYRTALGLPTKTFADFPNERRTLYSSVADVDLYVGLMLEAYRVGGVSQTAAALAFGQFQKLLTEDRQGYRNQFGNGFPVTAQLKALLVGDGGGSYGGIADKLFLGLQPGANTGGLYDLVFVSRARACFNAQSLCAFL